MSPAALYLSRDEEHWPSWLRRDVVPDEGRKIQEQFQSSARQPASVEKLNTFENIRERGEPANIYFFRTRRRL